VGVVSSWGRLTGDHHRGAGPVRDVAVLKGVNLAARREALLLPRGLRGTGAQAHHELATCLWARALGWRVVYDPSVVVDHFPDARAAGDARERLTAGQQYDTAYNLVAAIVAGQGCSPARRTIFGLLVGDGEVPGLGRGIAALTRGEFTLLRNVPASLAGQAAALYDAARGRGLVPIAPSGCARRTDR
jgi:hypothetical protein